MLASLARIALLLGLVTAVPSATQAEPRILAILVGFDAGKDDFNDLGVRSDIVKWEHELRDVYKYTGVRPEIKKLVGDNFTLEAIQKAVENVPADSDDTVLFYYGGHGFTVNSPETKEALAADPKHAEGVQRYPALKLTNAAGEMAALKLIDIYLTLKEKNPRLLLVIADCCDSWSLKPTTVAAVHAAGHVPDESLTPLKTISTNPNEWDRVQFGRYLESKAEREDPEITRPIHYKRLYLHEKGHYLSSGCKVGERSQGYSDHGGRYSCAFMYYLRRMQHTHAPNGLSGASWDLLFMGVSCSPLVTKLDPPDADRVQNPQWDRAPKAGETHRAFYQR